MSERGVVVVVPAGDNKAFNEELGRRWAAYTAARLAAERSHDIRDGIAAGQAWGCFLALFEGRPVIPRGLAVVSR